ncbi:SURF1 family protein [Streptomyces sp. RLB3-17]|uniref:SURF1 family protein n=1 Tax=unclassified Streptomyces TaxID=2593676 RepID=UPI0011641214|nr:MULTISPECIES: SURF1 family protein [unclassified Streptomyces]QDN99757.1 SURF1 family protein [Streptomyces sp. RLB1-9]QDO21489.1 SURF1 family protein [Streptomyces sp. S1A1-8]QDO31613.1 SURF1 family protein [Streptomyces sp. S1A1-3]QDO41550.1 SURF1 family protein [Streptomyces sp. RLB3-17]
MYRFLLTPRWWGINVFVLLAIPFCIFMGSWQLSRFEARVQDHRAAGEQAAAARTEAARPLARLLPVSTETSGKQATATGRYGKQLLVPGRELDGERGFYVLTLLRVDGGKALPVVRGWLPGSADPAKAPAAPTGEVTVTGALQASESPGTNGVTAAGGLPAGQTGAISSASLVNLVPYEVYDAWITLAKADSGMRVVPATEPQGTGLDLKAFQNLGYTGEWFVFAGFVVFMWFRLLRREAEFARDAELGLVPEHDEEEATVTEATARAETAGDTTAETTADATAQAAAAGAPQDADNIPVR